MVVFVDTSFNNNFTVSRSHKLENELNIPMCISLPPKWFFYAWMCALWIPEQATCKVQNVNELRAVFMEQNPIECTQRLGLPRSGSIKFGIRWSGRSY